MALPDIALSDLEMEDVYDGAPSVAPAAARFRVGNEWVLARKDYDQFGDNLLIMCLDKRDSPKITAVYASYYNVPPLTFDNPETFLPNMNWRRKLSCKVGSLDLTLWVFEKGASWSLSSDEGFGRWEFPNEITLDWLLQISDDEIRAQTQPLLADAESDCHFAFRWLQMSARERNQTLFTTSRETLGHCEQVLQWIMQSQEDWGRETVLTWFIDLNPRCENLKYAQAVTRDSELYSETHKLFFSARQSRLLELAVEYFNPRFNESLKEKTIVRDFRGGNASHWKVPIFTPTAHQRLEAQLQLRDFLRDKVSSTELAELMGG